MAYVKKTRVQDTATGSGTGALQLAGSAPTGFRPPSGVMANGDTGTFEIVDRGTGAWVEADCTWSTGNVLTINTVLDGTNGPGVSVSFAAGTKDVFMVASPSKVAAGDASGNVALPADLTVAGKIRGGEEGDWTPTDGSAAGLTLTVNAAHYSRVGRIAVLTFDITYPSTADASQAKLSGIPAICAPIDTSLGSAVGLIGPITGSPGVTGPGIIATLSATTVGLFYGNGAASNVTNAMMSGCRIRGTITLVTVP